MKYLKKGLVVLCGICMKIINLNLSLYHQLNYQYQYALAFVSQALFGIFTIR